MGVVDPAPGLVGRGPSVRELSAAVGALPAGEGAFVLLAGEPGMGKSALLRFAVRCANESGIAVYAAQCAPVPGAPPLWCWSQVIRAVRADGEVDRWLAEHLIDPDLPPEAPATDQRFRLYEAVASALESRSAGGGLLVAIDDLQWADDESLALLGFLARRLAASPVLLLGSYRDVEAGALLRDVAGRAEVLTLLGLDTSAVTDLIAQIQGTRPAVDLATIVHERAGGNPLFVRELTRLAVARGGWSSTTTFGAPAVPDNIAAILRERLDRLSGSSREVLVAAALVGPDWAPTLVAAVLDRPVEHVLADAEEAVRARVVIPTAGGHCAFVHDLYRDVLLADLDPVHRAELNRAIADALIALGPDGPDPVPAGRLAAHYLAGGIPGRDRARHYARLAAHEAAARFAHIESVRHLETALGLTDEADPRRADLLLELGSARSRAGDRTGAATCFRRVAGSDTDPRRIARAALGMAALGIRSGTSLDDNVALLRNAIALLDRPDTPPGELDQNLVSERAVLVVELHAALARELVHSDLPGPRAANEPGVSARRAVALAERSGDPRARASALLAQHDVVWRPGGARSRLPVLSELILAADEAGDDDLAAEGLLLRAGALIELGDPVGVADLRRFVERAVRLGHPRGHWLAVSRRATLATIEGKLTRAASLAAEALEIGREIGIPDAHGCYGTMAVSLGILGHRVPVELPPVDDPVARLAPLMGACLWPADDHREAVRAVPTSVLHHDRDLEQWMVAAAAFARWGTSEQCRVVHDVLRTYQGLHAVIGGCAAYYGPVDDYVGRLAVALGDPDPALEHFRTAARQARRLGAPAWVRLADEASAELAPAVPRAEWVPEGPTWRLSYEGTEVHLADAKGLRDIAVLLAAPGREIHVYTLLGRGDPATGADPVLDDEARRSYRVRAEQLREEIADADRAADAPASEAASVELETLLRELVAASGLHGRTRRLGDEVERARKTVSARIRDALRRIAAIHPALAAHLTASLEIGTRCSYQPAEPTRWRLK